MTYYVDSKGQVTIIKQPSIAQKTKARKTIVSIKPLPKLKPA